MHCFVCVSTVPNPEPYDPFAIIVDEASLKRRSLHGSLMTVISQGVRFVVQLGSQVILARLLFPSDFGLLAMVYPVLGFIQVFGDIGLGQAIVQRSTLIQAHVSALFWINIAFSFVVACVVFAVAPAVAWVYGEPRVISLMFVLGLLIPISALGIHPFALLSRQMRFSWLAWNEVISSVAGIGATIVLAWQGWSYWSLVAGQIVSTLVGLALAWRLCGWLPSRPKLVPSVWIDLKFGSNLAGANIASFLTTSADNILVGLTTGQVALGLYDRSYRLVVQPIGQMLSPISRVAVPLLSRLHDRPSLYRSTYLKMFQLLMFITVPAMLICITNSEAMIHIFLGSNWAEAAPIFSWICVGGLTSGIYSSAYWMFTSQGRTREMRQFTVVAAGINIASFIGGSYWGVVGIAASGALVFVIITTPLFLYGATRCGPVQFRDLVQCTIPFVLLSVVTYLGLFFLARSFAVTPLITVTICTLFSYAAFLVFAMLTPNGRQVFGEAVVSIQAIWNKRRRVGS